jgi:hypothetical protein
VLHINLVPVSKVTAGNQRGINSGQNIDNGGNPQSIVNLDENQDKIRLLEVAFSQRQSDLFR